MEKTIEDHGKSHKKQPSSSGDAMILSTFGTGKIPMA